MINLEKLRNYRLSMFILKMIKVINNLGSLYKNFKVYSVLHGKSVYVSVVENNKIWIHDGNNNSMYLTKDGKVFNSGEVVIYPSKSFTEWNYLYTLFDSDGNPKGNYIELNNNVYYTYPSKSKNCIRCINNSGLVSDLLDRISDIRSLPTYSDEVHFKRTLLFNKLHFLLDSYLFTEGICINSLELDVNKFIVKFRHNSESSEFILDLDTL